MNIPDVRPVFPLKALVNTNIKRKNRQQLGVELGGLSESVKTSKDTYK